MSVFHDDPFSTSDAEGDEAAEVEVDGAVTDDAVAEEDEAQDNEATRPNRKRSREPTPTTERDADQEQLNEGPAGIDEFDDAEEEEPGAPQNASCQPEEEMEPATVEDGESSQLNEALCQQLAAQHNVEREASTVSLRSTVLEQGHLIRQLQADKVTMQSTWDAERAELERALAHHRSVAERSSHVAAAMERIVPETVSIAALEHQRTAEGEAQLALCAAEHATRRRLAAEAEADALRAAMAWQSRATMVYKVAYDAATKRQLQPKPADVHPVTGQGDAVDQPLSQWQLSEATSTSVCASLDKAREWLLTRLGHASGVCAEHPTESEATERNDAPVAVALPVHAVQQLAQLLSMLAEHVRSIGTQHDMAARDAMMQSKALHALMDGSRQAGLYDLEPRIALLRETIERQVNASIPTTQEALSLHQCQQLQSRVSLLEAVVCSHILRADKLPEPGSVVPHVLKERIGRCDALEKEVAQLRAEVAFLQRLIAQEGTSLHATVDAAPHASMECSDREALLESCGRRWLGRAHNAMALLVAQASDAAMWAKGSPLLEAELVHATQHADAQHAVIICLQESNEILRQQLHACSAMAEVLIEALRASNNKYVEVMQEDVGRAAEDATLFQRVADTISERCRGACVWTEEREDHTVEQFNNVCERLDVALAGNVSALQQLIHDKEVRHLNVIRFLCNALAAADGALSDILGLASHPVSTSLVALEQLPPVGSAAVSRTAATLTRTVDVRSAVAKVTAAHHEALQKVEQTFRGEMQQQQDRWDWLLSQDGNAALHALAKSRDECIALRAANAAAEERAAAAKRLSDEVLQLKKRLAEREARVVSLEGQLKVSQESLSKNRQEMLTITRDSGARALALEQELAGVREQVAALELQLATATARVVEENANAAEEIESAAPFEAVGVDTAEEVPHDVAQEAMNDDPTNTPDEATGLLLAETTEGLGDVPIDGGLAEFGECTNEEETVPTENEVAAESEDPTMYESPAASNEELPTGDAATTLFETWLSEGGVDGNEEVEGDAAS